jgi:hypothetical protein
MTSLRIEMECKLPTEDRNPTREIRTRPLVMPEIKEYRCGLPSAGRASWDPLFLDGHSVAYNRILFEWLISTGFEMAPYFEICFCFETGKLFRDK